MPLTKAYRKIQRRFIKKPTQAIIETTNSCNLNCPFCLAGMQNELVAKHGNAAHNLMSRPAGFMTEETFSNVHRELSDFGIRKVYLHFQGEPMLNKLTPHFAMELKRDNFEVGIFTNGQAFNDTNIDELAKAEIDLIRFSVDGACEETYQKNRVGGTFEKVSNNMKKVALAHKGKRTRIEWQFIAMRNNEQEIEKARNMAEEIGINFFVKGFRETLSSLAAEDPKYRAKYLKKPCADIYHQVGIYWNGDVVPCCYDVDGKEVMGNINKTGLKAIWSSKAYSSFRKNVDGFLRNPEDEPSICRSCLRWK